MEPCTVHGQPYSCYNLFFAAPFFPPGVIKTPQFYTIPREKAPGTYRIFVFGESAAEGDPDFAYGFARYLEVMLRDRFPKQKFEIVNTGMVAINSNVTRLIARDLAAYQPDFYLVYAGSNEVVGPMVRGPFSHRLSFSRPMIRASIFVRSHVLASCSVQRVHRVPSGGGWKCFSTNRCAPTPLDLAPPTRIATPTAGYRLLRTPPERMYFSVPLPPI